MEHKFVNVRSIFKKYGIINVPYYQRDYVWGSKNDGRNLYKFIDDIFTQYNNNPSTEYFIGTLAFCSSKVNDVIDGQQRLTSLVLILSILSDLKCSQVIKDLNKQLIEPSGKFFIQEENYLTEDLKRYLGLSSKSNSQNDRAGLSKTVDRIKSQVDRAWSGNTVDWYDGLYKYILDKVMLISLEYNNISESLKYFLNINSLSIQLTQADIFFSILSQTIRISGSTLNIFDIKQKIAELGELPGITSKEIDEYKDAYDDSKEKGVDNVIYTFLNAFYQRDNNISFLKETGVGKWMSFYKNDVFTDPIKAQEFTKKFYAFLGDFETIYCHFANMNVTIDHKSSLYMSWILLQYEAYFDILKTLLEIFRTRHNYIDGCLDLYESGTNKISLDCLNEIGKRLNLTILWNYIRSSNKRLDGFITNISLDSSGNYTKSIADIVGDIDVSSIFNLNYNDKNNVSNVKIADQSRLIKVILGYQEAFLNHTANPLNDINDYLQDILKAQNFSIEHLYSKNEYLIDGRLNNWKAKKGKFNIDSDFDTERFKFENLSLLDGQSNSSANDKEIHDKLAIYKNARKVCSSEWEYLIQSLVDDSEYYRNANIAALHLPKRALVGIDQNTWELSANNREFNIELLKLALDEIAKK